MLKRFRAFSWPVPCSEVKNGSLFWFHVPLSNKLYILCKNVIFHHMAASEILSYEHVFRLKTER